MPQHRGKNRREEEKNQHQNEAIYYVSPCLDVRDRANSKVEGTHVRDERVEVRYDIDMERSRLNSDALEAEEMMKSQGDRTRVDEEL